MFCGYCGKEVRDDLNFCVYCGKRLIKPDTSLGNETGKPATDEAKNSGYPSGKSVGTGGSSMKTSQETGTNKGIVKTPQRSETQHSSYPGENVWRVTFNRPARYTYVLNVIRIVIDGSSEMYKLENGKSIEVQLKSGKHQVEFSVFGLPRKTEITLNVDRNRSLFCYPSAKSAVISPMLMKPVTVEDENGQKLS